MQWCGYHETFEWNSGSRPWITCFTAIFLVFQSVKAVWIMEEICRTEQSWVPNYEVRLALQQWVGLPQKSLLPLRVSVVEVIISFIAYFWGLREVPSLLLAWGIGSTGLLPSISPALRNVVCTAYCTIVTLRAAGGPLCHLVFILPLPILSGLFSLMLAWTMLLSFPCCLWHFIRREGRLSLWTSLLPSRASISLGGHSTTVAIICCHVQCGESHERETSWREGRTQGWALWGRVDKE